MCNLCIDQSVSFATILGLYHTTYMPTKCPLTPMQMRLQRRRRRFLRPFLHVSTPVVAVKIRSPDHQLHPARYTETHRHRLTAAKLVIQFTLTPTAPPAVRASGGITSDSTTQGTGARPELKQSTKRNTDTAEMALAWALRPKPRLSAVRQVPVAEASNSRLEPSD